MTVIRKKKGVVIFVSLALLVFILAFSAKMIPAQDYIIGPKDVLEIKVYEQPDLHQTVRVSEEGRINLSLVGEVTAAGYTVEQLSSILRGRYSEYIYHPQVSVFVAEYHSKEIYVLGEVRKPGLYTLKGSATLLEVISQAGGITEAGGERLVIIRRGNKGEEAQTIGVDLSRLLKGGSRGVNIAVMDGDTIYVPRANFFFVFGEVKNPGSYKLEKDLKITVLKAVTLAGGFTDKASKNRIKITREKEGQQETFKADLNDEVRPHDIIIIPESFF